MDHELSNAPVVDLDAALDPALLAAWIEFSYAAHAAAIDALLTRFVKFSEVTASGIADDFVAGHAADFARDLKAAARALDETHTRIKKPVLHAQRLIDGAAKALSDRVASAVREVEARVTAYLKAKEAEAREALRIEAEKQAAEAPDITMAVLNQAEEATALELTRTRGVGGALTALQDRWVFEVVDITKVPTHLLQVNDAAVRAAIKQGAREVPGIRIWNNAKAMIR